MTATGSTLHAALSNLLREGVAGATERERTAFDEAVGPLGKSLVLFGAGGLGRRTLAGLHGYGVEPLAFADNNRAMWGRQIDSVPVLSPEDAAGKYGDSAVFVITIWGALGKDRMRDRIRQLKQLGCQRVVSFGPLYWKYPHRLLPHYAADLPHKVHAQADAVYDAFDLWSDEASRMEYISQVRWRLLLDFDCLANPVAHSIYFPRDLCALSPKEVFVDCGAYDGDTLRLFLAEGRASFRRIVAFEPDPANFARLEQNVRESPGVNRDAISLCHAATGAQPGRVRLIAEGNQSSAIGKVGIEVDRVTLDDALWDQPPTYMKMDIEGAELDTLDGARGIIEKHSPVLAICCYHRQDHLWKIPLLIRALNSDYCFFLRPHDLETWDLVCYGIPKERLKVAL